MESKSRCYLHLFERLAGPMVFVRINHVLGNCVRDCFWKRDGGSLCCGRGGWDF